MPGVTSPMTAHHGAPVGRTLKSMNEDAETTPQDTGSTDDRRSLAVMSTRWRDDVERKLSDAFEARGFDFRSNDFFLCGEMVEGDSEIIDLLIQWQRATNTLRVQLGLLTVGFQFPVTAAERAAMPGSEERERLIREREAAYEQWLEDRMRRLEAAQPHQ